MIETVRCFIAIELPPDVKEELTRLQSRLRSTCDKYARWVDPNGIHLTLKFLGNVPKDKIEEVIRKIEQAAQGIPSFKLAISGAGCFPSTRRPQVVWVGISGETDKLNELVKRFEAALEKLGFKPEGRPFSPHLTLARVSEAATREQRQVLGETVGKIEVDITAGIVADEVCLMQSDLTPKGAIYTKLAGVKLNSQEK